MSFRNPHTVHNHALKFSIVMDFPIPVTNYHSVVIANIANRPCPLLRLRNVNATQAVKPITDAINIGGAL